MTSHKPVLYYHGHVSAIGKFSTYFYFLFLIQLTHVHTRVVCVSHTSYGYQLKKFTEFSIFIELLNSKIFNFMKIEIQCQNLKLNNV